MENNRKRLPQRNSIIAVSAMALVALVACMLLMGATPKAATQTELTLGLSNYTPYVTISIAKPKGWLTKETPVKITVDANIAVSKVEAKTSSNSSFIDITDDMQIDISENCTVYVQATDKDGAVYSKSRYLEVFDREAPTVKARIDKKLLRIEANDDLSGVAGVYVDGEKYTDLTNDTIDIPLREIGKEYADIEIQAVDSAGNKSKIVTVRNPNYKDDSTNTSLNSNATSAEIEKQDGTGIVKDTKDNDGTATAIDITLPTSENSSSQNGGSPNAGNTPSQTTSGNSSDSNSGSGSGSSSNNGSSDAPLFGTYEDTKKQYMSIVTEDGAVYYLIIDHDKESENVYFLSPVTNAEIASFTPPSENVQQDEEYPAFIEEQPKEDEISFIDEEHEEDFPVAEEADETAEESPSDQSKTGSSIPVFMIIVILGVGGAGYYFKIYKPKKELENVDDLDDFAFAEGVEDTDSKEDEELMFD